MVLSGRLWSCPGHKGWILAELAATAGTNRPPRVLGTTAPGAVVAAGRRRPPGRSDAEMTGPADRTLMTFPPAGTPSTATRRGRRRSRYSSPPMSAKTVWQSFLLLVLVGAVAAGCGGSSKKGSSTTTTVPAAVASYVSCLKSHGMPSTPTSTLPPAQVSSAHSACQASLPPQKAVNYKDCLKSFGVSAHNLKSSSAEKADAHYPAASQICADVRKKSGTGTSTTAP